MFSSTEVRLLRRLVEAGAVAPDKAHPLPPLRRASADWQAQLLASGLLREAHAGRFYVDAGAVVALVRKRRIGWALMEVAVALAVAAVWLVVQRSTAA